MAPRIHRLYLHQLTFQSFCHQKTLWPKQIEQVKQDRKLRLTAKRVKSGYIAFADLATLRCRRTSCFGLTVAALHNLHAVRAHEAALHQEAEKRYSADLLAQHQQVSAVPAVKPADAFSGPTRFQGFVLVHPLSLMSYHDPQSHLGLNPGEERERVKHESFIGQHSSRSIAKTHFGAISLAADS